MTTALVAVKDVEHEFHGHWRPKPPNTDHEAARRLGVAFCDGWYLAISDVFRSADSRAYHELHRTYCARYAQVRDYLYGDCDFEFTTACIVATQLTRYTNRF